MGKAKKLEPPYNSASLLVILNEFTKNKSTKDNWQDLTYICQKLSDVQKSKNLGIFSGAGADVTIGDIRPALNELLSESLVEVNYNSTPPRARLTSYGVERAGQVQVPDYVTDLLKSQKS